MDDSGSAQLACLGTFSPPDAERLLDELVASGMEPEISVDDGIRNVSVRHGSAGMMAQVQVYVPSASYEKACSIRDEKLKLMGEV